MGSWLKVAVVGLTACSFSGPSGAPGDSPDGSTGIGGNTCGGDVDSGDLISHWQFSREAREVDLRAVAQAEMRGAVSTISGPTNCGDAVAITAEQSYGEISDQPEWDGIRSIDLFVRYSDPVDSGILSRDSINSNDGNFDLALDTTDGQSLIAVRVQGSGVASVIRCAPAPAPDTWFHIGINLGGEGIDEPIELWVNGVEGTATGAVGSFGNSASCGDGGDRLTLAGSPDQWLIGVSGRSTSQGSTSNLVDPFVGGAIDNLRFVSRRRDFATN